MKNLILSCVVLISSHLAFAKAKIDVEMTDARIFAPLKGSNATAGYVTFKNTTKKPAVILLKKADPFKAVEMHETVEKEGRMAMQKIDQLTIEPGKTLELKPGAHHMMLFDATKEVKAGDVIKVLFLVNGSEQELDFKVIDRTEKKEDAYAHH